MSVGKSYLKTFKEKILQWGRYKNAIPWGWGDGSVFKSTACSSRELEFASPHP